MTVARRPLQQEDERHVDQRDVEAGQAAKRPRFACQSGLATTPSTAVSAKKPETPTKRSQERRSVAAALARPCRGDAGGPLDEDAGTIAPHFDAFDDGEGTPVPPPDASGFRNEPIRDLVLGRFNKVQEYQDRFGEVFNGGTPLPRGGITFAMIGSALAEFELSLTFANAPIDRFARGESAALTRREKQGAVLFFGRARCVACHRSSAPVAIITALRAAVVNSLVGQHPRGSTSIRPCRWSVSEHSRRASFSTSASPSSATMRRGAGSCAGW